MAHDAMTDDTFSSCSHDGIESPTSRRDYRNDRTFITQVRSCRLVPSAVSRVGTTIMWRPSTACRSSSRWMFQQQRTGVSHVSCVMWDGCRILPTDRPSATARTKNATIHAIMNRDRTIRTGNRFEILDTSTNGNGLMSVRLHVTVTVKTDSNRFYHRSSPHEIDNTTFDATIVVQQSNRSFKKRVVTDRQDKQWRLLTPRNEPLTNLRHNC